MAALTATFAAVRECDRLAAERDAFLRDLPPYPEGKFSGRGAVILGEGKYEPGIYVAVKMLRQFGFLDPVQVWTRPSAGALSGRVRSLPGVEVVDADARLAEAGRISRMAWAVKLFGVLGSPFEEVLFLDADAYPVRPVGDCFDPAFLANGWMAWPDHARADGNLKWEAHALPAQGVGVNGGHYAIHKGRGWRPLNVASWIDDRLDFYHGRGFQYGDQDSPRVAWAATGSAPDLIPGRPRIDKGMMVQRGPDSDLPMFVHRTQSKFGPAGFWAKPALYEPSMPGESDAWFYYLEWLRAG